jgi:CDP-6-deoxy-D-xylo-4-hexulose-3-dehydrase
MNYKWPLINDNVTEKDKLALISFLSEPGVRLTQGKKVEEFEKKWSEWLGVKYSVMVNSGASANYIMTAIARDKKGIGEIIVPPLGWVSDIAAVVNLGMKPVFVDISMQNLAIAAENIELAITKNTKAIVLVHTLGFNGLNQKIIEIAKKYDLMLIEDCCESHGATFENQKVGTFGDISNFSFYFGHHMTTVEGGMVCTNSEELYELAKLYRSHGMIRELSEKSKQAYALANPTLNPLFTFVVPGFNMRSTELNAVIGIEQLKNLDVAISARCKNLNTWLANLDENKFYVDFDVEGSSNFSLPLILKKSNAEKFQKVCELLEREGIEYRKGTAGGGNQARQPYLKSFSHEIVGDLKNVDHVHDYGLYIGNHSEVSEKDIVELCKKIKEEVV